MRRTAWTLIGAGAVGWGLAALLRARFTRGDLGFSGSYLLDVVGLLALFAGAILEARVASLFLEVRMDSVRRRAIGETVVGIVAALAGCVALGAAMDASPARALLAILLGLGIGVGLAGCFSLAWFYGLDWAAGRMERLDHAGVDEARRRLRDRP
jgi:hypothetical protein